MASAFVTAWRKEARRLNAREGRPGVIEEVNLQRTMTYWPENRLQAYVLLRRAIIVAILRRQIGARNRRNSW